MEQATADYLAQGRHLTLADDPPVNVSSDQAYGQDKQLSFAAVADDDYGGFTHDLSDSSEDEAALAQIKAIDTDSLQASDAVPELGPAAVRALLKRMRKLEGKIRELEQGNGNTPPTPSRHDPLQSTLAPASSQEEASLHMQEQEVTEQQQREQHYASLQLLHAAQAQSELGQMHFTVHPDHLVHHPELAADTTYGFDTTHLETDALPVPPTGRQRKTQNAEPRARKRRKKEERGEGQVDAMQKLGQKPSRVRANRPKKIATPALNRLVLRRMYQLIGVRSNKDNLPHPSDPLHSVGQDHQNITFQETVGGSAAQDAVAPLQNSAAQSVEEIETMEAQQHELEPASSSGVPAIDGLVSSPRPDQTTNTAAVSQADPSAAHTAATALQTAMSTEASSLLDESSLADPEEETRREKGSQWADQPLQGDILAWQGFVPNWHSRKDSRNEEWLAAIAQSVLECLPIPDPKWNPVPEEHLQLDLAVIAARTSLMNLCHKYKQQTDEAAMEKAARHRRLTRRKGRRTEKLMRRQKAREAEDFLATEWHIRHPHLDVDVAVKLEYMSSEHSEDEDEPQVFKEHVQAELSDGDPTRIILELRTPRWQSETLRELWRALDETYLVVVRKLVPEHYIAPAHPRFRRHPARDLPPRLYPTADWMVDETWRATHEDVLQSLSQAQREEPEPEPERAPDEADVSEAMPASLQALPDMMSDWAQAYRNVVLKGFEPL